MKALRIFALCLIILVLIFSVPGLNGKIKNSTKRSLTHEDYDSWKSIVSATISANGHWVLYLETPQDGEADLVVENLKSKKEYLHTIGYSGEGTDSERAAKAQFTHDSTHVVFLISPSKAEIKKAKKNKKEKPEEKPKKKLGIMDLSDGSVNIMFSYLGMGK